MAAKDQHIASLLQRIPEQPGVYQYLNREGTVIYVGKAKNLKRRVSSYFRQDQPSLKTRQLVAHIADIKYVVVGSEQDAFLLENNLIKQYQPHYNILLKDGKSYPYICITREAYPRIFKTRQKERRGAEYFGPYSFSNAADTVLELIHKLYPLRTCNTPMTPEGVERGKYKVCLKYHIRKCCGICEQRIPSEQYAEYIQSAKKIIRGDAHEISRQLMAQMQQLSAEMRYEEAARIKEQYLLVEKFRSKTVVANTSISELDVFGYDEQDEQVYISMLHVHNGSIVQGRTMECRRKLDESREELLAYGITALRELLESDTRDILVPFMPDYVGEDMRVNIATGGDRRKLLDLAEQNVRQYKADRLKQADKLNPDQRAIRILTELQNLIGLPVLPMTIDAFDNSSIQGSSAVSACVVFKKAKPSKNDYKRFEIREVTGQDDFATMREVVRRRYQRIIDNGEELPNLIIADGGIGQMHAIREAVEDQLGLSIPIAGLKKDDKHRTQTLLYGFPPMEFGMPVTSETFRLLTSIQDEVHRFAISYHIRKRSKALTRSELDDIQGVGPATKQKILQHFGSVRRAGSAELAEWVELLGNAKGSMLYEHFQSKITR
ncbi:MAG: excinuclease ABC subunit C [Paludibacteraceae bacterium]|nr:excinuclease ABC subunit C [Paludibacteraceae bacterium]